MGGIQFIKKRFPTRPNIRKNNIQKPKVEVKTEVVEIKKEDIVESPAPIIEKEKVEVEQTKSSKNKKKKEDKDMINKEQLAAIEAAMDNMNPTVKVVKQDRGLIERTESSKIIITEDNRQVLND
jgi:hypothetical protein